MNLLSACSEDRPALQARQRDPPAMLVVGLCAPEAVASLPQRIARHAG